MKVILNADDYGRDRDTTDAIVECFLRRKITSSTLMVVHEDCDRAAKIAKKIGLPVGLHLCLDEGHPVADPETIPSLLNERGELSVTSRGLLRGKFKRRELFVEIMAQIKKMVELGLVMTHLDSHHHIHCHPLVFSLFVQWKKMMPCGLKIRMTRNYEPYPVLATYGIPKYTYKVFLRFMMQRFFRSTDYFTSIVSYFDREFFQLKDVLASLSGRNVTLEIECHPGKPKQYSFLLDQVDFLSLAARGVELIDYSLLF